MNVLIILILWAWGAYSHMGKHRGDDNLWVAYPWEHSFGR